MSKIAIAGLLVLFCACSRTKTLSSRDGSVTVTEQGKDEAAVHITGKDGKTALDFNSGKAITDYPSDVPLYKGKSLLDMKSAEKNARSVSIETPDPVDQIAEFYKAQLESKGWKSDATMTMGEMTMYTASKDNRKLVVQITSEGDKRMIMQHLADAN